MPLNLASDEERAKINKTIWRLNEAAMYLSRYLQYDLCGHRQLIPLEVLETLDHICVQARTISIAMETHEGLLTLQGGITACLECVEDQAFGREVSTDE